MTKSFAGRDWMAWVSQLAELAKTDPEEGLSELNLKMDNVTVALELGNVNQNDWLFRVIVNLYILNSEFENALKFIDKYAHQVGAGKLMETQIGFQTVFDELIRQEDWRDVCEKIYELAKSNTELEQLVPTMAIDLELTGPQDSYENVMKDMAKELGKIKKETNEISKWKIESYCKRAIVASLTKGDFERTQLFLELFSSGNPQACSIYLSDYLKWNENFKKFKKSKFAKDVGSQLPKDKLLASAYVQALEEPFKTYQKLEKHNDKIEDKMDRLAVQHFCISLICSDLSEHGEDNIGDYGNGKMSLQDFKLLEKKLKDELKPMIKKDKPSFWAYKGFKTFKDIPF